MAGKNLLGDSLTSFGGEHLLQGFLTNCHVIRRDPTPETASRSSDMDRYDTAASKKRKTTDNDDNDGDGDENEKTAPTAKKTKVNYGDENDVEEDETTDSESAALEAS